MERPHFFLDQLESCSDDVLLRIAFPSARHEAGRAPGSLSAIDPRLSQKLETGWGLTKPEIHRILATLEWFRRSHRSKVGSVPSGIHTPEQAWRWFRPWGCSFSHEVFFVVLLDSFHVPIECERIAEGSVDSVPILLRTLFSKAVYWEATAMLCFHNHPSRDGTPSSEDIRLTRKIGKAADLLGIRFLDHIIGSPKGAYSLAADRRIGTES